MSTAFELKQFVVRDGVTGAVVEGAEVGVYLDNGSGGKGSLAPQVFTVAGALINQATNPITTDAGGLARFRLAPGTYFLEVTFGATVITRPGLNAGMASARDVGSGTQQLPLPAQWPAAMLGRAPNAGDAGKFFVFNDGGSLVLGALWEISPPDGRAAGRVLQINGSADGLAWVDLPEGVLPALTGEASKVLVVNDTEDAVEWADPPEVVYPVFTDRAGWVLRVNSGETDVEWWNPNQPIQIGDVSTSGNRVLTAGDHNTILEASGTAAVNFVLPLNSVEPIPIGSLFTLTKAGTGDVSVSAASGVLLNGQDGLSVVLPATWDTVTIYKRSANGWAMAGKFEAPE